MGVVVALIALGAIIAVIITAAAALQATMRSVGSSVSKFRQPLIFPDSAGAHYAARNPIGGLLWVKGPIGGLPAGSGYI